MDVCSITEARLRSDESELSCFEKPTGSCENGLARPEKYISSLTTLNENDQNLFEVSL